MTFVRILFISFLSLLAHFATANQQTILVLGDSLSAGYGIKVEEGWVNWWCSRSWPKNNRQKLSMLV